MNAREPKMNRKRLALLERVLRKTKPHTFNLAFWFSASVSIVEESVFEQSFVKKGRLESSYFQCGAVACAFGVACGIPSFQRDGLRVSVEGLPVPMGNDEVDFNMWPRYRGKEGFEAAMGFFGITINTASLLFNGEKYPKPVSAVTPTMVANRIRALLDGEWK